MPGDLRAQCGGFIRWLWTVFNVPFNAPPSRQRMDGYAQRKRLAALDGSMTITLS